MKDDAVDIYWPLKHIQRTEIKSVSISHRSVFIYKRSNCYLYKVLASESEQWVVSGTSKIRKITFIATVCVNTRIYKHKKTALRAKRLMLTAYDTFRPTRSSLLTNTISFLGDHPFQFLLRTIYLCFLCVLCHLYLYFNSDNLIPSLFTCRAVRLQTLT